MKSILLSILLLVGISVFSQDTTRVTLAIKARLVQTLTPFVKQHYDDTLYSFLFNKWVAAYNVATLPAGTDIISVDSVSDYVIAALYDLCQSFPQGAAGVGNDFASDITTIRSANVLLGKLCSNIDTVYAAMVSDARIRGRKILRGKSN